MLSTKLQVVKQNNIKMLFCDRKMGSIEKSELEQSGLYLADVRSDDSDFSTAIIDKYVFIFTGFKGSLVSRVPFDFSNGFIEANIEFTNDSMTPQQFLDEPDEFCPPCQHIKIVNGEQFCDKYKHYCKFAQNSCNDNNKYAMRKAFVKCLNDMGCIKPIFNEVSFQLTKEGNESWALFTRLIMGAANQADLSIDKRLEIKTALDNVFPYAPETDIDIWFPLGDMLQAIAPTESVMLDTPKRTYDEYNERFKECWLTEKGWKAYEILTNCVYTVGEFIPSLQADNIVDELDKVVDSEYDLPCVDGLDSQPLE